MPYTIEDFRRDYVRKYLHRMTVEERLAGLSLGEIVQQLSPEERLAGLSPEEVEAYLKRLREARKTKPSKKRKPKSGR
jgi:hypothetical protein